MQDTKSAPHISQDIIDYLNRLYPDILPSTLSRPHRMYFLQGQISVVKYLNNIYKRQQGLPYNVL